MGGREQPSSQRGQATFDVSHSEQAWPNKQNAQHTTHFAIQSDCVQRSGGPQQRLEAGRDAQAAAVAEQALRWQASVVRVGTSHTASRYMAGRARQTADGKAGRPPPAALQAVGWQTVAPRRTRKSVQAVSSSASLKATNGGCGTWVVTHSSEKACSDRRTLAASACTCATPALGAGSR